MKYLIIVLCLFLIISCSNNKELLTYKINSGLIGDTTNRNDVGIDFLFNLKTDTVFEYNGKPHAIILPLNWDIKNTLWSNAYYTAKSHPSRNLYFLIKKTDSLFEIIVDENGNYDFSDEIVQTKSKHIDSFNVYVHRNYEVIFRTFYRTQNDMITERIVGSFNKHKMMPRHNSTYKFLLQERRCNYKLVQLNDSNFITIQDYDCNGLFNDKSDKIYSFNYFTTKQTSQKQATNYTKNITLPCNNQNYTIKKIEKLGNEIQLKKSQEKIDLTNNFNNIEFKDDENKTIFFNSLSKPNPLTVLYFWGTWCKPCIEGTDSVNAFYNQYKNVMNFYSLNYADKLENIQKYKNYKKIDFPIFSINQKNTLIGNVEYYPQFVIINSNNIVLNRTSSWKMTQEIIKKTLNISKKNSKKLLPFQ